MMSSISSHSYLSSSFLIPFWSSNKILSSHIDSCLICKKVFVSVNVFIRSNF